MPTATELFQVIGDAITGFMSNLGSAFSSVTALFWTTGTNGGAPTFLGLLMLLGIGVGLCYLAFRLIRGAVYKLRG